MSYTEEMTEYLEKTYFLCHRDGLTNKETIEFIKKENKLFDSKNERSIRAKIGTMNIWKADEVLIVDDKKTLVAELMKETGIASKHFDSFVRMNKPVLEDLLYVIKELKGTNNADN